MTTGMEDVEFKHEEVMEILIRLVSDVDNTEGDFVSDSVIESEGNLVSSD